MSLSYTNGTTVTTGNDWCSAIGTEPYTDSSPNDYYGCRVVLAFHTKGGWVKSGTRSYSLKENHYSSSGSASESNVKIENNTYHIKIDKSAWHWEKLASSYTVTLSGSIKYTGSDHNGTSTVSKTITIPARSSYTLSYNTNGGSSVSSKTVQYKAFRYRFFTRRKEGDKKHE